METQYSGVRISLAFTTGEQHGREVITAGDVEAVSITGFMFPQWKKKLRG